MSTDYQIFSEEPTTVETSEVHLPIAKVGFLGPAILVALVIFLAWIPLAGNHIISDPNLDVLPLVELGGLIVSFLIFKLRQGNAKNRHANAVAEKVGELQAVRKREKEIEADKLTRYALGIRTSFEDLASGLDVHVSKAERYLEQAQQDVAARAFAPFWDKIEAATNNLAEFHRAIAELDSKAKSYYKLLNGKRHNFPPLNDLSQSMPDPEPVTIELRRLVRQGQTDIDFATILEHRKTRRELKSVVGEAIADAGSSISYGIEDLRSTLSSGLDGVTREQRRMGDKLEATMRK